MARNISDDDLVIHFLNVGFGDNIIVQFPADINGQRKYGLVDCKDSRKTLDYLDKLTAAADVRPRLSFVCATHPHMDHIAGINGIMNSSYCPEEFWDSGFRHNSLTYRDILLSVAQKGLRMIRVTSGMEWYFHNVRVTALSPSVALRNRYATYGVDMNNASIVLRLENNSEDVLLTQSREYTGTSSIEAERKAGRSVVILAGDAEFDSWSYICQEFPRIERTSAHNPLVKKMVNYLSTAVIKVAHHGSMHSTPLDVYEKMSPSFAVISTRQEPSSKKLARTAFPRITRNLFPHESATIALEESDIRVFTTDGSYEGEPMEDGNSKDPENGHPGSIVAVIRPTGGVRWKKLTDSADAMATPPTAV